MPPLILTFGDSTTAAREGVEVYTDQLRLKMPPSWRWLNRGVPGNTTEMARARFEAEVLSERPQVVVIQFGINDATTDVWQSPPATAPRVSLSRYEENLRHFITSLRAISARSILMTPNPVFWTEPLRVMYGHPPYDPGDEQGFMAGREGYSEKVRRLAWEEGVPLVDVEQYYRKWERAARCSGGELIPDGIHPGTEGHRLVARALQPVLEGVLAGGDVYS